MKKLNILKCTLFIANTLNKLKSKEEYNLKTNINIFLAFCFKKTFLSSAEYLAWWNLYRFACVAECVFTPLFHSTISLSQNYLYTFTINTFSALVSQFYNNTDIFTFLLELNIRF